MKKTTVFLVMIISLCLLGLLVFTGCRKETKTSGSEKSTPLTLTVYAGMLEEHAALECQEFEKATGIKTSFVRMSGGEILARIRAEAQNPQASVWYGGGSLTFIEADNLGLLEYYISPTAATIPARFKDPKGAWTGIYSGYLGFYADGEWLKKNNVKMPTSWDELLSPVFKGEIVMAHPGSSSTAYNMLTTILQIKGEQAGWDYLQKINENIRQYTKSGSAGGRMVQLHETGLTIGYLHDAVAFKREGYDHIVISAPEEGTGYEIGAVGIIKGAPQLEAAKKFIDWCLTPKAQELGQTVNALQFLTNPAATPPKEVEAIKATKLINQDDIWAGAHRSEFLDRFNEISKSKPIK
ncbi:ABC transporter substrate-binding protein [Treponema primitia]|uniref:ABC transporter substrate-binding protein n=1 Tax=Treponema primitia TaxID=88058 RepID=UPI00397FD515